MLQKINKFISRIIIEPEIITFVSRTAFSEDENLKKIKVKKNNNYGEFKI